MDASEHRIIKSIKYGVDKIKENPDKHKKLYGREKLYNAVIVSKVTKDLLVVYGVVALVGLAGLLFDSLRWLLGTIIFLGLLSLIHLIYKHISGFHFMGLYHSVFYKNTFKKYECPTCGKQYSEELERRIDELVDEVD